MDSRQIIAALKELRIPHEQIAQAINRDRSAATKMLSGQRSVKVSEIEPLSNLIAMARENGNDGSQTIVKLRPRTVEPLYLPVRFRVQAGYWIEVDVLAQDYPASPHAVVPDPAFDSWPQWLELVEGDSVDLEIKPGSYAHVVDAIEMGYRAADGDFVVVERRRDQGRLRERSIKQVRIAGHRIELWPRSSNPAWDKPLDLTHPEDGVEVEVVGLVIGAYRGFR